MENEIMNVAEVAEAKTVNVPSFKGCTFGTGAVLVLTGVGAVATGYGVYKGIKWLIGKAKAKKTAKVEEVAQEAPVEAKAEESTAE